MPGDPERVAETKAWLIKALVDLRAAEHLLVAQPPLTGLALFHAQQAVEKTLKAFLSWHDIPFRKTHDLSVLGQQCLLKNPAGTWL
jgi:HEPN domain-containing protein